MAVEDTRKALQKIARLAQFAFDYGTDPWGTLESIQSIAMTTDFNLESENI